jgi:hypothetical protein
LADNLEAVQLGMAEDLLGYVQRIVAENEPADTELRVIVTRLSEALRDAPRVAESRGNRIPPPEEDEAFHAAKAAIDREMVR